MECFVEVSADAIEQLKKDLDQSQKQGQSVRVVFEGFG
jgi:hypothetical protein